MRAISELRGLRDERSRNPKMGPQRRAYLARRIRELEQATKPLSVRERLVVLLNAELERLGRPERVFLNDLERLRTSPAQRAAGACSWHAWARAEGVQPPMSINGWGRMTELLRIGVEVIFNRDLREWEASPKESA